MASPSEPAQRKRRLRAVGRCGLALLLSFVLLLDQRDRVAIAKAIRDPLSVFGERSPGGRPEGALAQSKPRRLDIGAGLLSKDHIVPPRSADSAPSQQLAGGGAFPALDMADGTEPLDDPANDRRAGGYTGPMGFPVAEVHDGPGGGRSGEDSGRQSPDVGRNPIQEGSTDNPPIVSVPEPASWLTMITGFLVLGGIMRRRQAARRTTSARHGPTARPLAD